MTDADRSAPTGEPEITRDEIEQLRTALRRTGEPVPLSYFATDKLLRAADRDVARRAVEERARLVGARLIQTTYGKWLAVSSESSPLRIGVIGDSEDDAREKFACAMAEWLVLLEPEPAARPATR